MGVSPSLVEWCQNWYKHQCNGEWEHVRGITIESMRTPGWSVTIDLEGTDLEDAAMPLARRDRSPHDWIQCRVERNQFLGQGDPQKLAAILRHFQQWAIKTMSEKPREAQLE